MGDTVTTGTVVGLIAIGLTGLITILGNVVKNRYDLETARLKWRLEAVEKAEAECRIANQQNAAELASLRLRATGGLTAFYVWAAWDEVIIDATYGVKDVIGYIPSEIVGHPVSMLISDAIKDRHHEGIEAAKTNHQIRRPDLAIKSRARHKSGHDVNVIVSLELVKYRGQDCLRAEVSLRGQLVE